MQEYGQVDGVISFWELSQPLVARLAEQLSLPGNPPDAVDNARDKQVWPCPGSCNPARANTSVHLGCIYLLCMIMIAWEYMQNCLP